MTIKRIKCWCGMETWANRPHYPGNDPENGPAHLPENEVICPKCDTPCPPDCIDKERGICQECISPSPVLDEYRVILAYHARGGIAFSHHATLSYDEADALRCALAQLRNGSGINLNDEEYLRRWCDSANTNHHDDLPAPVVYEIIRDDYGNEVDDVQEV